MGNFGKEKSWEELIVHTLSKNTSNEAQNQTSNEALMTCAILRLSWIYETGIAAFPTTAWQILVCLKPMFTFTGNTEKTQKEVKMLWKASEYLF